MTHTLNLESARRLFHSRPPSTQLFGEIMEMLDVSKPLPPVLEEYLCEHFSAWPNSIERKIPDLWLKQIRLKHALHVGPWFNCADLPFCSCKEFVSLSHHHALTHVDCVSVDLDVRQGTLQTLEKSAFFKRMRSLKLHSRNLPMQGARGLRDLLAESPLETLSIQANEHVFQLAELWSSAPFWKTLRSLDLQCPRYNVVLDVESIDLFLSNASLQSLYFMYGDFAHTHAEYIASSPRFAGLQVLSLRGNYLRDRGAVLLSESPHLSMLRSLDLSENLIGPEGAMALATSPAWPHLEQLNVSGNPIQNEGLQALLSCSAFVPGNVCPSKDTLESIAELRQPKHPVRSYPSWWRSSLPWVCSLPKQERVRIFGNTPELALNLSNIACDIETIQMLAESPQLASISHLVLRNTSLNDAMVSVLAESPYLENVRALELQSNHLTVESIFTLGQSKNLPNLEILNLYGLAHSFAGVEALLSRDFFPALRFVFFGTRLTPDLHQRVVESHLASDATGDKLIDLKHEKTT